MFRPDFSRAYPRRQGATLEPIKSFPLPVASSWNPSHKEPSLASEMEMESSVESLDHPVDNAPVRSLVHKGLTVEGYSRAAVQTYWRVPELKMGFDLGAQPWSFMSTPNWF